MKKRYRISAWIVTFFLFCAGSTLGVAAADAGNPILSQINALSLHEAGITGTYPDGTPVRVVVIDTGIDYCHPAFTDESGNTVVSPLSYNATTDQIVAESDYTVLNDQPRASNHGTMVCGTIASQLPNARGVAPDCELIVIKADIHNNQGAEEFDSEDLIRGLTYAVSLHPAPAVINISWTITSHDKNADAIAQLLKQAREQNILVCVAAGNDHTAHLLPPANDPNVFCVGAVDDKNEKTNYSNFGPAIDVVAPGNVVAVRAGGGMINTRGTSFASPIVAGIAALYIGMHPGADVEETERMLRMTADDLGTIGRDDLYGYGLANAAAACFSQPFPITLVCEDSSASYEYYPGYDWLCSFEPDVGEGKLVGWFLDPAFTQRVTADTVLTEGATLYAGVRYEWILEEGYVVTATLTDYPGTALTYPEKPGFTYFTEDEMPAVLGRKNVRVRLFWILDDIDVIRGPQNVEAGAGAGQDTLTFDVRHGLGEGAVRYQWFFNDEILAGETGPALTLSRKVKNSGTYSCVATVQSEGQSRTAAAQCTVVYRFPAWMPFLFFIPAAGIVMIAVSAVKKKKRPTGDETGSSAENP